MDSNPVMAQDAKRLLSLVRRSETVMDTLPEALRRGDNSRLGRMEKLTARLAQECVEVMGRVERLPSETARCLADSVRRLELKRRILSAVMTDTRELNGFLEGRDRVASYDRRGRQKETRKICAVNA